MKKTFLIIGLGNPDTAYNNTAHNIGRDFLIHSLEAYPEASWGSEKKLLADIALIERQNLPVIYALTQTFMNESGRSAQKLLKRFSLPRSRCLIIHDDSDLIFGRIKFARASRSAGHHGVESIIKILKGNQIARIRIGVRPAAEKSLAGTFILKKLTSAQTKMLALVVYPKIEQTIDSWLNPRNKKQPAGAGQ